MFFSSGVLDASERDSARKTRWNSAINQEDRTSDSSSSGCSPVNTLRKAKKSRNEATLLLRFAGDINILVTPLMLEALQRCVTRQCRCIDTFNTRHCIQLLKCYSRFCSVKQKKTFRSHLTMKFFNLNVSDC